MTGIGEAVTEAAEDVGRWFRHDKENTVTDTVQTPAGATADAPSIPYWPAVHQNLAVFASRVESFLPKLARIADAAVTTPVVDDVIEAALLAAGMGTAEEVFAGVVALLKAAPEDQESAAFGLLKAVMHQPGGSVRPAAPPQQDAQQAVPRLQAARSAAPQQPQAQAQAARTVVQ